jgi:hypothetical protein
MNGMAPHCISKEFEMKGAPSTEKIVATVL